MGERYYYAELNENSICTAVSDLSGEVVMDTMIRLETYDETLLGKRYENGQWHEVPAPEPEEAGNGEEYTAE